MVVDVTTIRDLKVGQYYTVKQNVPLRLEPAGTELIPEGRLGRIEVRRFNAFFQGGEPVLANDRLLVGTTYYTVESLEAYGEFDRGVNAIVREMTRAQSG